VILEIPLPHASIKPALKNAAAMFLLVSLEGCVFEYALYSVMPD